MSTKAKVFWIHALTPVHIGVGQGVGFIDLPIMREKVTNWPIVPSTAVKGVVRDFYHGTIENPLYDIAFGKTDQAGSLVFTDARLVCLPVRSYFGTYAYVTCSLALRRLKRDLLTVGIGENLPDIVDKENVRFGKGSKLAHQGKVYLEEYDLDASEDEEVEQWSEFIASSIFQGDDVWSRLFKERFAVVSDEMFDFLCETGTEVTARVKIDDDKKIVQQGALWYEEYLPAESILAGIVWCDRVFGEQNVSEDHVLHAICKKDLTLQIGRRASVGKGQIRCLFNGKEA